MPPENHENQRELLRQPPHQGGPRRITDPLTSRQIHQMARRISQEERGNDTRKAMRRGAKRRLLKRFSPYLIAGTSTGMGMGLGLSGWIF